MVSYRELNQFTLATRNNSTSSKKPSLSIQISKRVVDILEVLPLSLNQEDQEVSLVIKVVLLKANLIRWSYQILCQTCQIQQLPIQNKLWSINMEIVSAQTILPLTPKTIEDFKLITKLSISVFCHQLKEQSTYKILKESLYKVELNRQISMVWHSTLLLVLEYNLSTKALIVLKNLIMLKMIKLFRSLRINQKCHQP